MDQPLISVIVPAWNAEATLGETLTSVAAQSYRNLEILIVDDGSTDPTASIAEAFAEREPRSRVLHQRNAGVAAARNAGIEAARGAFIAPIDADDVWHPDKIQRQVQRLQSSADDVGLVYNWSRIIDERGIVVSASAAPVIEGCVLRDHLRWNFIGNGSTPMFRAEVLRDLRYSPQLRSAGHEGCEDYLLQLQIASKFKFACVPAFLTGYRTHSEVMSADLSRMIRSHIDMYELLLEWLPRRYAAAIERQRARQLAALGVAEFATGRLSKAAACLAAAFSSSPGDAGAETWSRLIRRRRSAAQSSRQVVGRHFASLSPEEGAGA
jgi:glycosyltransferase involved in cell wall biosynthesis